MSDYQGTYTTNLNLSKDSVDDSYDVERVNSNSDKIDKWAGEVNTSLNDLANERGYARVKRFEVETDLNALTESGVYASSKFLNSHDNNKTWKIVEVFNMSADNQIYCIQRIMGIADGGDRTFERRCNNGIWSEWKQLATTEKPTTIKVTPLNGFVTLGGSPAIYYKTKDSVVNINCFLQKTSGVTGETILFNLPAGYRPKEYLRCTGVFISGETPTPTFCNIMIEPAGNVIAKTALTFSNVYVNVSFLAEN